MFFLCVRLVGHFLLRRVKMAGGLAEFVPDVGLFVSDSQALVRSRAGSHTDQRIFCHWLLRSTLAGSARRSNELVGQGHFDAIDCLGDMVFFVCRVHAPGCVRGHQRGNLFLATVRGWHVFRNRRALPVNCT